MLLLARGEPAPSNTPQRAAGLLHEKGAPAHTVDRSRAAAEGAELFAFELIPGAHLQLLESKAITTASDANGPCVPEGLRARWKVNLFFFLL